VIQKTRGGSFEYYEPAESSTTAASPTLMTDHTGFRLAHENGLYAGGANGNLWFSPQEHAGSLYRQFHLPGGVAKTVGFRLAWDREGQ